MDINPRSFIYVAVFLSNICTSLGNTEHISYIGCFYDAYNPQTGSTIDTLRVLPHTYQKLRNGMTIGTCIEYCTDKAVHQFQMQYAGLEGGDECWCGRSEARYDLYGQRDDSECMRGCSGNPSQYCGNDFRIAVYNLTLVRCQLPYIQGLDTSNPDVIPVYDNTTFTCLPGYQLSGPDTVQCIFDDGITDTRWASDLPRCLSIPTTTSTTSSSKTPTSTSSEVPLTNVTLTQSKSHGRVAVGIVIPVLVLVLVAITCVVVWKRKTNLADLCSIDKAHRDKNNHDQEDQKVTQTTSDDKVYLELDKPTMQESTYQGLVSPHDSSYQGLVNPQISTYQGLIIPQEQRSSEVYAVVGPNENKIKAHETGHSEYQNVPDPSADQNKTHETDYSDYQNVQDSNTYQNTGPTNTSQEGKVPIPPPVDRDKITDEPGDYVNVKNH